VHLASEEGAPNYNSSPTRTKFESKAMNSSLSLTSMNGSGNMNDTEGGTEAIDVQDNVGSSSTDSPFYADSANTIRTLACCWLFPTWYMPMIHFYRRCLMNLKRRLAFRDRASEKFVIH
jgi:hypothetical protein